MISIIVPSHNRLDNLLKVIPCFYNQKGDIPFEVILVDDFSSDDTPSLASKYKSKTNFKYLRLNKKDTWNASRPRNYGARIAEGEALLFVDSDIMLNEDALRFYWEDFSKNKERVVIGRYDWLPPENENVGSVGHVGDDIRLQSFEKAKTPDMVFNTVYDGLACFGGNLLVPKEIFFKAGGYDEDMKYGVEDGDFGITLWEMGVGFSYDERTVGKHLWHPLSSERAKLAGLEVKKLDKKHNMDLVYRTGKAYRKWGFNNWKPHPAWYGYSEENWLKIKEKIDEV